MNGCKKAPEGWQCSREEGHEGPCAAHPENGYMQYVPQLREKIGWKLFPPVHFDAPDMVDSRDCFHCHVVAHFSFIDRLRILLSGEVKVTSKTSTENLIGEHVTASGVHVLPPKFLRRKE